MTTIQTGRGHRGDSDGQDVVIDVWRFCDIPAGGVHVCWPNRAVCTRDRSSNLANAIQNAREDRF